MAPCGRLNLKTRINKAMSSSEEGPNSNPIGDEKRREFIKIIASMSALFSGAPLLSACSVNISKEDIMTTKSRFDIGWEKLKEIDGHAGENVISSLRKIAPDLAKYTIEFPFGDVYSRGGLDLKSREIATVAALTALGNAAPQLKVHIHGALNVGCSPEEVIEVIIQMAVYAGFPAALNAAFSAQEVFEERGIL